MSNTSIYSKLTEKELLSSIPAEANLFAEVNGETKRVPGYVMDIYATKEDLANIPTPDVSGQIAAHNEDVEAHADIRAAIEDHNHSWSELKGRPVHNTLSYTNNSHELLVRDDSASNFETDYITLFGVYNGNQDEYLYNIEADGYYLEHNGIGCIGRYEDGLSGDGYHTVYFNLLDVYVTWIDEGGVEVSLDWYDITFTSASRKIYIWSESAVAVGEYILAEAVFGEEELDETCIPSTIARTDHTHSWNDLSDKPFGNELTEIVFADVEVSIADYKQGFLFGANLSQLVDVDTVTVIFAGVEYKDLTVIHESGDYAHHYVGNASLSSSQQADTGEPFCIDAYPRGDSYCVFTTDAYASTVVDLKVFNQIETTKLIDEQFIPESIAHTTYVDEAIASIPNPAWDTLQDKPFGVEEQKSELFRYEGEAWKYDNHEEWLMIDTLEEGKTYVVSFDGVEYEVTAEATTYYDNSGVSIGNQMLGDYGPDTNEPFFIHVVNYTNRDDSHAVYFLANDRDEHTFIVYGEPTENIHTLDEKFIPNTIARTSDIPEAAQPDWNAPEGEPGHVLNRTHWVEEVVVTNENVDTTAPSIYRDRVTAYLVSDEVPPTFAEKYKDVGSVDQIEVTEDVFKWEYDEFGEWYNADWKFEWGNEEHTVACAVQDQLQVFIVFEDNANLYDQVTFPHKGIYMPTNDNEDIYPSCVSYRISWSIPHPLSPELGGMPTLAEDGSDAGKFVMVNSSGTGYVLVSMTNVAEEGA